MQRSARSRPAYLPRFPRLQLQRRRRRDDEVVALVDSDFRVHVLPNGSSIRIH